MSNVLARRVTVLCTCGPFIVAAELKFSCGHRVSTSGPCSSKNSE